MNKAGILYPVSKLNHYCSFLKQRRSTFDDALETDMPLFRLSVITTYNHTCGWHTYTNQCNTFLEFTYSGKSSITIILSPSHKVGSGRKTIGYYVEMNKSDEHVNTSAN